MAFDARKPRLRALLGFGGVTAPVDSEPAVGAGPDAGVIVAAPIDEIVPALGARPRVVGNFVGRKTRGGADRLRQVVEVARQIFVRQRQLSRLVQAEERRLRFDGELIEREMFCGLGDGALELGAPGLKRLPRPRVDEIEGIALENRARDRDRIERFLRAVQAAEFLQRASSSACTPSETRLTPAAR